MSWFQGPKHWSLVYDQDVGQMMTFGIYMGYGSKGTFRKQLRERGGKAIIAAAGYTPAGAGDYGFRIEPSSPDEIPSDVRQDTACKHEKLRHWGFAEPYTTCEGCRNKWDGHLMPERARKLGSIIKLQDTGGTE